MPEGLVGPGKASPRFMKDVVYESLGSRSSKVRKGPGVGLDNAIIAAGDQRVLIVTVDPISEIPALGVEASAWLSVHLIASDFATSGARPEFATFSYNLPRSMSGADQASYVRAVGRACKDLGVSIVAGHTGSYPGAGFTVLGSGTMFGFAGEDEYLDPSMASEGDAVLMTKHAAIEATFSLALSFPAHTRRKVGRELFEEAKSMVRLCSTVEDSYAAVAEGGGGVTSMHDATEGGVLGALQEMSDSCGKRIDVSTARIPVSKAASAVCRAFGVDPLASMGEGALIVTCRRDRLEPLLHGFAKAGRPLVEIGSVSRGRGLWLSGKDGGSRMWKPKSDGYWRAYERSLAAGLR